MGKRPKSLGRIAEGYNFVRMMLVLSERYIKLLQVYQLDPKEQAIRNAEKLLDNGVPNAMIEIETALKTIAKARTVGGFRSQKA